MLEARDFSRVRLHGLDKIIQNLYEDKVKGVISEERYSKMATSYEQEQKDLINYVAELKTTISEVENDKPNTDIFLHAVKKYTDITELSAEILNEFIDKVYVYQAEKVNGKRTQKIQIFWNGIGEVDSSDIK